MKSSLRRLSGLLPWLGFLALLLAPAVAFARAGGGQSYSGGGSSSGGGGGDGGGLIFLLIRLLFWLIFHHPLIGIPLTILIVYVFIQYQKRTGAAGSQRWDSAPRQVQALAPRASRDLDDLRALDPEFSAVLFEDFAYALFARAHEARSSERDLEALSPYLSPAARAHLAQRQPVGAPVSGVVIGAMRVTAVAVPPATAAPGGPPPRAMVMLEFEANMTVGTTGAERTHYVQERWRLERDAGVQSKPPERALSFQCPNCGAPFGPEGGTAASTAARWSPAAGSTGASSRSIWSGWRSAPPPSPPTSGRLARTSRRSSTPS